MENLEPFETSCKDCIFAKYKNHTQVGCLFNRIEKFKERGVKIDECYDHDKEFYVIRERLCNTCRNQSWSLKDESLDQALIRVCSEIQLKPDVFIYLDENINSTYDLIKSVKSLENQDFDPKEVIIINNSRNKIKSSFIIKILKDTSLKWSIETITDEDKTKNRALDIAINKSERMLYVLINAGFELKYNFLSNIDYALNVELDKFIILLPDSEKDLDNGLVVLNKAHKLFNGNASKTIQEKLLEITTETGEKHLIKKYSELLCQK